MLINQIFVVVDNEMRPFRILIVENNRICLESLNDILDENFAGIVIEEAENAREAMEKGDSFRPNLIFMDIGLPDGSGLELTKKIKTKYPDVSVAMLTSYDGPEYREAAFRFGASHFLTKGAVTRREIQDIVKFSLANNMLEG